jgi:rod shape-determining protein MreB
VRNLLRKASGCDVSVDLGTSNIILTKADGTLLSEASVVAFTRDVRGQKQVIKLGFEAKALDGKASSALEVVHPLRKGVIAEFEMASELIRNLLLRVGQGPGPFKKGPRLLLTLPQDVTPVERRAFLEAGLRAGARDVKLLSEPMAAALGLGLNIFSNTGALVVDIGAGTTEIALFALGGIVHSHSLRVGGDDVDDALQLYLRQRYNFAIGPQTAEALKLQCLSRDQHAAPSLVVKGLDLFRGMPSSLEIRVAELEEAAEATLARISRAVLRALEDMPEDFSADLLETGIQLTGGGAMVAGLAERIERECGLKCHIRKEALLAVALGEQRVLRNVELSRSLLSENESRL